MYVERYGAMIADDSLAEARKFIANVLDCTAKIEEAERESQKLLPCPFCGSGEVSVRDALIPKGGVLGRRAWVQCNMCDAEGPWVWHSNRHIFENSVQDDAVILWNKRNVP